MIASIGKKENMLDSLDPRAGALKISKFVKDEVESPSSVELNLEPCDQKALTTTLDIQESGFTGQ